MNIGRPVVTYVTHEEAFAAPMRLEEFESIVATLSLEDCMQSLYESGRRAFRLSTTTQTRRVQIHAGSACAVVALLVEAVWTAVVELVLELVEELPGAALDPVVGDFAGGCDGQDGVAGELDWLAIGGQPEHAVVAAGDPPA